MLLVTGPVNLEKQVFHIYRHASPKGQNGSGNVGFFQRQHLVVLLETEIQQNPAVRALIDRLFIDRLQTDKLQRLELPLQKHLEKRQVIR